MGWKREFKKMQKETKKTSNFFDNSEDISSLIIWDRAMKPANHWNIDNLVIDISKYNDLIQEIIKNQNSPENKDKYSWNLGSISIVEKFYSYPMASYFKETYNSISNRLGSYEAALIVNSISKFSFYITKKFWKLFNYTFANKNINDTPLIRVFEVMQRTSLEALDGIIEKAFLLIDKRKLDPYRHHLLIEEIIDLGDDFTYHWSRMYDQVIDLTVETFIFQSKYGKAKSTNNSTIQANFFSVDEDEEFDTFFEKTKTLVFNDEVNDAFNYFGISKMAKPDEFKKIYRKMAKQFHPDLNSDQNSAMEMKKINLFKEIVEKYYEKYEII
ncbi:DnaJ domain-containing protein [Spiroplasma endosymbiont of Dioctria linearis]|uniref:DnaJ domain-containing protein n=1 Tax=Spiroplasma endosymbiont of Dioctria linearis TaxID=3066290 RepID=UPI00313BECB7